MGLHKLVEPGGEYYLPFALSKMRQLVAAAALNFGTGIRTIYADDGAQIRLSVSGTEQFIRIKAGTVKYQFTSTGKFVRRKTVDGSIFTCAHGVLVSVKKGVVSATPLGSTVEKDTETPPRWKYSSTPQDMSSFLPKQGVWQMQDIQEHMYYAKGVGKSGVAGYPVLGSSWSATNAVTGMLAKSPVFLAIGGDFDVMYDLSPALFRTGGREKPRGLQGMAPDSDWYRRAALHKVTSEDFGSRRFIVMTAVDGTFYAYPADSAVDNTLMEAAPLTYIQQFIKTNIPTKFVKSHPAPLPAWCRRAAYKSRDNYSHPFDGGKAYKYAHDVPQYVWQFDSAGKKACCIIYEDLPQPEEINGGEPLYLADGSLAQETLPGLVEVGIDITLTGKKPEDFTFSLRPTREFRPSVNGQYYLAAAYAWTVAPPPKVPPPDKPPPNVTDLDDLVVITGHVYHTSSEREKYLEPVVFDVYAAKSVIRVRNLTKNTLIRTFLTEHSNLLYEETLPSVNSPPDRVARDAKVQWSAKGSLLSFDLRILAFAVRQQYIEQPVVRRDEHVLRPVGGRRQVQRLQVYAYNKLVQQKLLDPWSPLNSALDNVHADTSTHAMAEFPCNEMGVYTPLIWPADLLWNPNQSAYYLLAMRPRRAVYKSRGTNGRYMQHPGPFHAGALLYAQTVYLAVAPGQNSYYDAFVVHPSGSWSLTTMPVCYYNGGAARVFPDTDYLYPTDMRQGRIDIISIRSGGKDLLTTHLKCFNEAYGKQLREEDFLYEFTKTTSFFPEGHLKFLGLRVPTDPMTGEDRSAFFPLLNDGSARTEAADDAFSIDNRGSVGFLDARTVSNYTPNGEHTATLIHRDTPRTRGSGLFF